MAKNRKTTNPGRTTRRAVTTTETDAPSGARSKIIQCAVKLFADCGLEGASVRDIARKARLNLSLVSYYFGGKEGLYRAVFQEHMQMMSERLKAGVSSQAPLAEMTRESFVEIIRQIVTQVVKTRMETPEISALMLRERLGGMSHCKPILEEVMSPVADHMYSIVNEAKKKGIVRKDVNSRAYLILMLESIWGYTALHDCQIGLWKDAYRFPQDQDEFIDFVVSVFTQGVLK